MTGPTAPSANLKCVGGIYLPSTEKHFAAHGDSLSDYQRAQREAAFGYVRHWQLALDIGANVGIFSKHFASRFEKVLAIEPCAGNYEALLANVPSNVECIRAAVGDRAGEVDMHYTPKACGGAHVCSLDDDDDERFAQTRGLVVNRHRVERVEMITVDSLQLSHLDLIKLDVQGCEELVLRGALKTIKRCRPVIIIEEKPIGGWANDPTPGRRVRQILTKYLGMTARERVNADRIYSFDD